MLIIIIKFKCDISSQTKAINLQFKKEEIQFQLSFGTKEYPPVCLKLTSL